MVPRKTSLFFAHRRNTLWVVKKKHGYLEHTDLDFELRHELSLRDLP
jgi:hypothetical protein